MDAEQLGTPERGTEAFLQELMQRTDAQRADRDDLAASGGQRAVEAEGHAKT